MMGDRCGETLRPRAARSLSAVSKFQSRMLSSCEAVANNRWTGENADVKTELVWPVSLATHLPVNSLSGTEPSSARRDLCQLPTV